MIPYGQMFKSGEVVLVHSEDEPAFFARIEKVAPDKKKGWWQLTLLILTIPLQKITWILDEDQMRGQTFTMNKIPMHISRVESPDQEESSQQSQKKESRKGRQGKGNVISMFDDD